QPGRIGARLTRWRKREARRGAYDNMKKSEATRTKISRGTRASERWRTANFSASGKYSNRKPIFRPDAMSRRPAASARAVRRAWRDEGTGRANAYATASGGLLAPATTLSRKANPKQKPAAARPWRREKRNPTKPRFAMRVRAKSAMGHRSGLWIRRNVAAISAARSSSILGRSPRRGHKPSVNRNEDVSPIRSGDPAWLPVRVKYI